MRNTKRGFTVVELVIVIAVIAILAAVLIPGFGDMIKKANRSTDIQLIRNLNTALAVESALSGESRYAQEAFDYVDRQGYKIASIVAKSEYEIAYDVVGARFVLLDTANHRYLFPLNAGADETGDIDEADYVNYFIVCKTEKDAEGYSVYAGPDWEGGDTVRVGVGFDAGKQTFVKVDYVSEKDQTVVIRTNSFDTELTVNAPGGVNHYGEVGDLTVSAVDAVECYCENGYVKRFVSFGTGKFVVGADARFHQTKAEVAALFAGKEDAFVEGGDQQYSQHIYGDSVITKNPTCTEPGTEKCTCTVCGYEKEEIIDLLPHEFDSCFLVDDVCHWHRCSRCNGDSTHEAHTFKYSDITDETHSVVCMGCGDNEGNVSHTYVNGVCACGKVEEP